MINLFKISPAVSPEILHHTAWRSWLVIALLRWKVIILPILTNSPNTFSLKGWENVVFEIGSERVKITYSHTVGPSNPACTRSRTQNPSGRTVRHYCKDLGGTHSLQKWSLSNYPLRPVQTNATCCMQHRPCCMQHVASFEDPVAPCSNFMQHRATSSNIVQQGVQTMQHVAYNNVGRCCMQHVAFIWTGLYTTNSHYFTYTFSWKVGGMYCLNLEV